jgi:hypothetical protein
MKIIKVTYSTKPAYAEQNAQNIRNVMNDLRQLGSPGIFYHVCLSPDGKTFTHTAFFRSEEDRKILNDLPSFKRFQEQLMPLGVEAPPQQELPTLVGSSADILTLE